MWIFSLIFLAFILNLVPSYPHNTTPAQLPALLPLTSENASKTEQLNILGYGFIDNIAWSPDGKTIAVVSRTGVIIYDAVKFDRAAYYRINVPRPTPVSVAFNPSGRLLGIVSQALGDTSAEINAQAKIVDIWVFKSQSIIAEWTSHIDLPTVVFSPDGSQIVLHNNDIAQLWDIQNISKIQAEGEVVWKAIQQKWYIPTNVQLDEIDPQNILAFAPNGQYVAEKGENYTIRIWDVRNKTVKSTIPYEADNLTFSPNGDLVALDIPMEGYSELTIWDIEQNKELYHANEALTALAFNPRKPQLLIAKGTNLKLWDKAPDTTQIVLGYSEQWWHNDVYSIAFSQHGNDLAVARMYQIEVWDSLTGIKLRTIDANEDGKYLNKIVYSPDGKLLATAGQDGYVCLWDANTLAQVGAIQHSGNAYDVVFSPDGKLLATYSDTDKSDEDIDPTAVFLWHVSDVLDKKVLQSKQALARIYHFNLQGNIYNVRFSSDGKMLALTGMGVEVWDVDTVLNRNPYAHKDGAEAGLINTVAVGAGPIAWSPDGKRIAVGQGNDLDCSFAIINVADNSIFACMKGHTGSVRALAFNPSGDLIASASSSGSREGIKPDSDNTVRIWDTATGKQLSLLNKHYEDVWTIAFNFSGTLLASGSGGCYHCQGEGNSIDGTVRLWGVPKS